MESEKVLFLLVENVNIGLEELCKCQDICLEFLHFGGEDRNMI